ncbi:MAG: ferritin [Bacteroidota bacterium]
MDERIEKLFNQQIALEFQSSMEYLGMATWSEVAHYPGAAQFLYKQSDEEKNHMMKLVYYLTDLGRQPIIPDHVGSTPSYQSLHSLFREVLANEQKITTSIHHLVTTCLAAKDYASFNFLQWFVEEQREEESTARKANDLFELIGGEEMGMNIYTIDQELIKLSQ